MRIELLHGHTELHEGGGETRYQAGVCNVDDERGAAWIASGLAVDATVAEPAPKAVQPKSKTRSKPRK